MRPHHRDYRVGKADALENLRPNHGMDFHLFEFFRGETAGFGNDVFGNSQLADVVQ